MKVIFLEDDRIEEVSAGYARNYLLPRKARGTPRRRKAVAAVAKRKEKKRAEVTAKRAELQALAEKLGATEIEIKADAGEGGKLFGSVTTQDIAAAAKQSAGVELDRKKIDFARADQAGRRVYYPCQAVPGDHRAPEDQSHRP